MAKTQWGIVYGVANPHHRVSHLPSVDDSELDSIRISPGEKMIRIPIVQGEDNPTFTARARAAIMADAGVTQLMNMRFAEIDKTGTVIMIHSGDAAFYSGPNTYVNCPTSIAPGHTYNSATGMFTIPAQTLPVKAGRAVEVIVPAQTVAAGVTALA